MQPRAIAVALLVPLLAFGAVHDEALLATVVTVALACLAAEWRNQPVQPQARRTLLAVALLAAVPLTQLVPLPNGILRTLNPAAADIWARAAALDAEPLRWRPLSVDPVGTRFVAATALTTAGFYWMSVRLARGYRARAAVARAVLVALIVFASVALFHALLRIPRLYGFYEPRQAVTMALPVVSPLLNPNHAAGLYCVALPLAYGLWREHPEPADRLLAGVTAVVCSTLAVLTLSRGGMAVLALEALAIAAHHAVQTRRRTTFPRTVVLAFLAAAVIVAGAFAVARESVVREATDRSVSKTALFAEATRVARAFPLVGAGRGAFGTIFPAYEGETLAGVLGTTGNETYTHAECWPVQWTGEGGFVFLGIVLVGFVWALYPVRRTAFGRPVTFGATTALAGLVVHDLADFSLEFAGVAGVAGVLLGIVTAEDGQRQRAAPRRLRAAIVAVGAAVAGTIVLTTFRHGVEDDRRALHEAWRTGQLKDSEPVRAAILRHPAEPYFWVLEGVRRLPQPEAGGLLSWAVRRGPLRAQAHFWLARWFVAHGRSAQAFAEYREALRLSRALTEPIIDDILRANAPLADVLATIVRPEDYEATARSLDERHRDADADAIDEAQKAKFPPALGAWIRQIGRARKRGDAARARQLAVELLAVAPREPAAHVMRATVEPDDLGAELLLSNAITELGQDPQLLEALVRRRGVRLGVPAVASEATKLRQALVEREGTAYRVDGLLAEIELARGMPGKALAHYLDGATASPDGLAFLDEVARIAEQVQRFQVALSALRRLEAAHPNDPRYPHAIERVLAKAASAVHSAPTAVPAP